MKQHTIEIIGISLMFFGIIGLGILFSYVTPYDQRMYHVKISCNTTYIYIIGTDKLPNSTHIYATPQSFDYEARDLYFIIYNVERGSLIVHISYIGKHDSYDFYSANFNVTRGFSWHG